jgi:hypothetical protein
MPRTVKAICERFAEFVTSGDVGALADMHVFPCPFVVEGRMIVLPDRPSFMIASAIWTAQLAQQGVRRYSNEIMAQELPRGTQFRVWLRWLHHMADGSVQEAGTDVVYLARQPDGRLLVEMVEIVNRSRDFVTMSAIAIG